MLCKLSIIVTSTNTTTENSSPLAPMVDSPMVLAVIGKVVGGSLDDHCVVRPAVVLFVTTGSTYNTADIFLYRPPDRSMWNSVSEQPTTKLLITASTADDAVF